MTIFAEVGTPFVAALTSGAFVVVGQFVVWFINRATTRSDIKNADNADERAEEAADIERYRNLANDALIREKLAYDRATRAEDKLNLAIADTERLRDTEKQLQGQLASFERANTKLDDDAKRCKEDLEQCRRHIRIIEAEMQRRGIDANAHD